MSSKIAARTAFAVATMVFALQLPIHAVWSEPYPALYMPGFGTVPQTGDEYSSTDYRAFLISEDGSELELPAEDLLPPSAVLQASIIRERMFDAEITSETESKQWFAERVAATEPGSDAIELRLERWRMTSRLDGTGEPTAELVDTNLIVLEGQGS